MKDDPYLNVFCVHFFSMQYFNSGPNFNGSVAPRVGGVAPGMDFCPFQRDVLVSNNHCIIK